MNACLLKNACNYRWDLIIRGNPVKCKKSFKNGTVEDGRGLFSEVKLRLGTPERFSTGENRAGS